MQFLARVLDAANVFKIAPYQHCKRFADCCSLGDAFVYEAPAVFMALWKAISVFLPDATRSRIHFITESEGWGEYSYLLDVRAFPCQA